MSEIKIPVRWLKEKGVEISLGDVYMFNDGSSFTLEEGHNINVNFYDQTTSFITSFADRENTGEQPVPGWVPVSFCLRGVGRIFISRCDANHWDYQGSRRIVSWKPNIESLYEIYLSEINEGSAMIVKRTAIQISEAIQSWRNEFDRVVSEKYLMMSGRSTWLSRHKYPENI